MTTTAGYSGKPLAAKLGLKAGHRLLLRNVPDNYLAELLGELPAEVTVTDEADGHFDVIHFFTRESQALREQFPILKAHLTQAGAVWISWPKGSSKVPTDLNENLIREIGLDAGLVDVKVAAVDAVWSALKFVIRLKDRTT
jgi:hypothetical protein